VSCLGEYCVDKRRGEVRRLILLLTLVLALSAYLGNAANATHRFNIPHFNGGNDRDRNSNSAPAPSNVDPSRTYYQEKRLGEDWDYDGLLDTDPRDRIYGTDNRTFYEERHPGADWDEDGLSDDDSRDRIFGRDRVPDPDPDPNPMPKAEETTQSQTTPAEEITNSVDSANTSEKNGPGFLGWLVILFLIGYLFFYFRRGSRQR
jgi:hypothetical protein